MLKDAIVKKTNNKDKGEFKFVVDDTLNHDNFGKARLLELTWENSKINLIYQKDGYGPKLIKLYLDRILNPEVLKLEGSINSLKDGDKVFCQDSGEMIGVVYVTEKGRRAIRLNADGAQVNIKETGVYYYSSRNKILNQLIESLNLPGTESKSKYILGISGFPGAGKSTLTEELEVIFEELGYNVIVIRQDDFRIAKKERYNEDGSQKHPKLPLVNQWHDWNDLSNLITDIKSSKGEQTFTCKTYESGLKEAPKDYIARGFGDIVLLDGAFIFNVGADNIYGVAPDAIKKQLDKSLFIYRGSPEKLDINWIIDPIFEREKANHPEKSDKENHERATYLANIFIEDIKNGLPFWQKADIYFDNTDLDLPKFTIQ